MIINLGDNQFTTSIWGDEGFSAILSMKSIPEILEIISRDTSPPLWNLTEHLAFQLFGTSELVIRGLASFYFLLTIFFIYKIGSFMWDKKTGLIAATLTLLNPFFFTYAFEGRMYSIMALGVASSMYFFLRIIHENHEKKSSRKSRKNLLGYTISTLWAMYSHHFAIFILLIQGLWFLYELLRKEKKVATQLFKGFLFVGIGYLPWLVPLYNQTKMVGGGFWLGTPTPEDLARLILEYTAAGITNKHLTLPLTSLPFYQVSLLLSLAILIVRMWGKKLTKAFFFLSWFLGPILLTWIVSQFFQSIFFNRYLLYAIPAIAIVLASERRRLISEILITFLILVLLIINVDYFFHPVKRPFRELSTFVKKTRQDKDFLINWNAGSHHLWETKYYDIPAPIYIPEGGELPFFVGTALMEKSDIISEFPKNTGRVGVVTSGQVEDIVLPGYTESEVKKFKQPWQGASEITFIWYEKDKN